MSSPAPIAHPGARTFPAIDWRAPLVLLGGVALGGLVAASPQAAVSLAAVPVGIAALTNVHARLLIVVFGGMFVLDRSSGFDFAKVLYLCGLAICVGAAWQNVLRTSRTERDLALQRSAGIAWLLMLAVVAASFPVATLNGHAPTLWLRDAAPYLMLGAVPVLALDASRGIGGRFLASAFVAAGLLGAASMAVDLIGDRQLATLPVARLFFDGFLLPAGLYAYACARALRARQDPALAVMWAIIASGLLGVILVTGTRVGLLLLVAPIAMLITGGGLKGVGRGLVFVAVGLLLIVLTFRIGEALGLATDQVEKRLRSTEAALRSPTSDYSLVDRIAQTRVSWELFTSSPTMGVGPGRLFRWDSGGGRFRSAFTLDSSVSTLAKFGLLGVAGLLLFLLTLGRMARRIALPPDRAALVGLLAIGLGYLALSNPFEDKGLAYALLFMLALALRPPESTA